MKKRHTKLIWSTPDQLTIMRMAGYFTVYEIALKVGKTEAQVIKYMEQKGISRKLKK
tara:strand:+ start:1285 stop:1455 length:171 start_codon:yes stop_codon:yes gene_type:complete